MSRKQSKTVPVGNGPIPQVAYVMPGGITLMDFIRVIMWEV